MLKKPGKSDASKIALLFVRFADVYDAPEFKRSYKAKTNRFRR